MKVRDCGPLARPIERGRGEEPELPLERQRGKASQSDPEEGQLAWRRQTSSTRNPGGEGTLFLLIHGLLAGQGKVPEMGEGGHLCGRMEEITDSGGDMIEESVKPFL